MIGLSFLEQKQTNNQTESENVFSVAFSEQTRVQKLKLPSLLVQSEHTLPIILLQWSPPPPPPLFSPPPLSS